jgi:hypothetical protein
LLTSFFSVALTWWLYRAGAAESLNVTLKRAIGDDAITLDGEFESQRMVIGTLWECTISNNGSVGTAIVESDVREQPHKSSEPLFTYRRMNGGLFAVDRTPLSMPLNLPPGTTTRILCRIGIEPSPKFSEILREHLQELRKKTRISMSDVARYLPPGEDFYGNRIGHFSWIDGTDTWAPLDGVPFEQQEFVVLLKTARGNTVKANASWWGQHTTSSEFK